MKQYMIWLKIEWKRAARRLPFVLTGAIIMAGVAGMIAFCGFFVMGFEAEQTQAVVAVVAEEDQLTDLALTFVENMESVQGWCRFERTDRDTGLDMMAQGKVIAVVELPAQVVEHILDGSNVPAVLYLPENMAVGGKLFQSLAQAGVSVLGTAQGEIYAAGELKDTYVMKAEKWELYQDINKYNLNLTLDREKLFRTKNLSGTENGVALYYAGAGLAVFLLCMGMVLPEEDARFGVRSALLRKQGITITAQVLGKWVILAGILMIGLCIPGILLLVPPLGALFQLNPEYISYVILSALCGSAMIQACHTVLRRRRSVLLGLGMGTLVIGFVCGCFVPEVLLPLNVQKLCEVLPLKYFREFFSGLLGGSNIGGSNIGDVNLGVSRGVAVLLIWTVACIGISVFGMYHRREDV